MVNFKVFFHKVKYSEVYNHLHESLQTENENVICSFYWFTIITIMEAIVVGLQCQVP